MGEERLFIFLRDCFTAGYTMPQFCIGSQIKKPVFIIGEPHFYFLEPLKFKKASNIKLGEPDRIIALAFYDFLDYTNQQVYDMLQLTDLKLNSDGSRTLLDNDNPLIRVKNGRRVVADKAMAEKFFNLLVQNNFLQDVEFKYPVPPHRYDIPTESSSGKINLTDNKSESAFADRFKLVQVGVKEFSSGKFIISQQTFSGYFNKGELQNVAVDSSEAVEIFAIEIAGEVISAKAVREALKVGDFDKIAKLVPKTTLEFLHENYPLLSVVRSKFIGGILKWLILLLVISVQIAARH